jgi:hypothetical protein
MGLRRKRIMVYSKETTIALIDYRINLMKARGEAMNMKLIAALEREKRNLEGKENAGSNL